MFRKLPEILVSACGAVAGIIMIVSYREYLVPGALIALEIIEAAAMIGVGRFGLDVLFIVAGGVLVVVLKQALFHRRQPMV